MTLHMDRCIHPSVVPFGYIVSIRHEMYIESVTTRRNLHILKMFFGKRLSEGLLV